MTIQDSRDRIEEIIVKLNQLETLIERLLRQTQLGASEASDEDKLGRSAVAARYGKHGVTISRWVKSGLFPPPDFMANGQPQWSLGTLRHFDAKHPAGKR